MSSRNGIDLESSVSEEKLEEEFNLTLNENFEDKVPTDWDNIEDLLRKRLTPPCSFITNVTSPCYPYSTTDCRMS